MNARSGSQVRALLTRVLVLRLAILAALRAAELLVLPATVFLVATPAALPLPIVLGVLAHLARITVHQRVRRDVRVVFMLRRARAALREKRVIEAEADSAFWGAHILEYSVCIDAPAIVGAFAAALTTLGASVIASGAGLTVQVALVLALLLAAGVLSHRLRRPAVDEIVTARQRTAVWMAAAVRDQGELTSPRAIEQFLSKVAAHAKEWARAEDRMERQGTLHRVFLGAAALIALLAIARWHGASGLEPLATLTMGELRGPLFLATSFPAVYALVSHVESLAIARMELSRLAPPRSAAESPRVAPLSERPRELVLQDLRVRYGDHLALNIDSLRISLESPLVITGPNGSGKTTLARVLSGVLQPSNGNARLDGIDCAHVQPEAIAFVPQEPVLIDALTGYENICLVAPTAGRAEALTVLTTLGMSRADPCLDEPISSFSRGEQRRVAIARALLKRPRLLVLDEPDAWLDSAGRQTLWTALRAVQPDCAIVVVSHRGDLIRQFSNVVVLSADHHAEAAGAFADVERESPSLRDVLAEAAGLASRVGAAPDERGRARDRDS